MSPSTSQDPSAGRGPAGGQLLPDFPEAKTKSCRARAEPPCVQEVRPTRSSERLSLPASGKRAIVPAAPPVPSGGGSESPRAVRAPARPARPLSPGTAARKRETLPAPKRPPARHPLPTTCTYETETLIPRGVVHRGAHPARCTQSCTQSVHVRRVAGAPGLGRRSPPLTRHGRVCEFVHVLKHLPHGGFVFQSY